MSDAEPLLRLDATVRRLRGSDATPMILGGSPLRLLRLRPPADAVVDALAAGSTLTQVLGAVPPDRRRAASRLVDTLLQRGLAHPVGTGDGTRSLADVTIVIPVHDRASSLRRLLVSLTPLHERGITLIVVDDGSSDGSGDVARAAAGGPKVVRHERAVGPAAARNAGAALVTTPLVAFLDSDVMPRDGWLDSCLAHLDALGASRVDLVAPRIIGLAYPGGSAIERYEHVRSPLDLGAEPSLIAPLTKVAYVPAAALVMRADAFRSVAGFDAALHVGEDVDLLWRLHAAGASMRYEPVAEVAHEHRNSLVALLRRRMQYGTSAGELDRRHPGLVPPAVLSPWSVLVWGLVILHPIGSVVGAGVAFATAERLTQRLPQLSRRDAQSLALRGHLAAGAQLADLATRTWFPATAAGALFSQRCRLLLAAGIIGRGWREHRRRRPALPLSTFLALRAGDDAAYGVGVWIGALRTRSIGALLPEIVNWPGRSKTGEDAMS